MSALLSSISGGGGGGVALAADLTYPSSRFPQTNYKQISGIDASAGLTTMLNLTGKFIISYLEFSSLTAESNTAKLTVDGVVIWDSSYTASTQGSLLLGSNGGASEISESITCNNSFLLEYQTATDPSITFKYLARPIL
tara:strand:- start:16 stop:432 length:417 start_codon:yes stop_codon:yes gene_type:complete